MMELAFSSRFFDDMESVEPDSKQDEIMDAIGLLPTLPKTGSRRIPASIEQEFGDAVRKLVVKSFLVAYEVAEDEEAMLIHGLVHQRRAR